MTQFEAVLLFALLVSAGGHVMQARTLDHVTKQLDYVSELYAEGVVDLARAINERNYYKREWAARWDAHARVAGQPVRHVGAGE